MSRRGMSDPWDKLVVDAPTFVRHLGHGHQPTPPPLPVPSAPLSLNGTPGDTVVSLSWQAPTSGAPITGYHVYRDGVVTASPSGTTATVTGLTDGQTYRFQVSALNATGEGPATSMVALTPVAVVTDYWSGIAFRSRPSSAGLEYNGGSDIEVSNKTFSGTISGSFPVNAALRFSGCHNVWVHDCDFDNLDWDAIDTLDCTGSLIIEHCRFGAFRLNVTGFASRGGHPDVVQMVRTQVTGYIRNNKIKAGNFTEDLFSVIDGSSGGLDAAHLFEIDHNAIQGGNNGEAIDSASSTGSLVSDNSTLGGHVWVHHNTYLNPGQVGIGLSMGVDNHATDNVIYGSRRTNSNVGIYTPYTGGAPNPGGHEVARNRVWWINEASTPNPYFDGGASGTISGESSNVWQDATIDPAALAVTL